MKNLFGQPTINGQILGCDACPLNKARGIVKIKGINRVKDQKAFIWGNYPSPNDNSKGFEFSGDAGALLWKTLKPVGLERKDFAIQNVVRCLPRDESGHSRAATKRETQCCSVFNEEALERNQGRAAVHLILGDEAGIQLLGKAYKKDKPVFWYQPWESYVVVNHHPTQVLQNGGERAGGEYYTWRDRFRAVRACMDFPGRWGYVKARKYKEVRTLDQFDEMEKYLRNEADNKRRVSFDIEDGHVDGKAVMLMAGFGAGSYYKGKEYDMVDWKRWKGECFSVVLDHPGSGYSKSHAAEMRERVKKLVEDDTLKKAIQNGSYDTDQCWRFLGAKLRGYDYDTQYGTFLRYSYLRSCGLENLTYRFFPEFADYKDTVSEWSGNFANAPIDRLVLRNSGDCDITKRLEARFESQVSYPLVKVYINAGITLDKMERRGPLLDWQEWEKAKKIIPLMKQKLDRILQHVSGNPQFDCDAPQQVAHLVYDVLGMRQTEEGRSTQKGVLELLMAESGDTTMDVVIKRRGLGKIESTYLDGYATSARLNDDELRTIWWLTGAVTGRLRSGKGDKSEAEGIINFQNLHGNPLLQNLLVSDRNWRKVMDV